MKKLLFGLVIVWAVFFANGVAVGLPADVIPRPAQVKELPGQFVLNDQTVIDLGTGVRAADDAVAYLAQLLDQPLGATLRITHGDAKANSILLTGRNADPALGTEGYSLTVKPDGVVISATTSAGLFYGIQSFRQLLPPQIESREKVAGVVWTVPGVEIKDSPRFAWRGLMLDAARHFEDKSEVKRLLDLMALHKLNVFHWHLTDDQGWRIEIKKYPKLTQVGAWRDGIGFNLDPSRSNHYRADGKYGGFYTQDDIREVVAYATRLHIMVVPEIEMPGHSQAALAAYPQYSCSKEDQTVGIKGGVMDAIYDAGDGAVFDFLGDVLGEVSDLFPGPYIHIGGDEVPKGPWKQNEECQNRIKAEGLKNEEQLQSYFVRRIERIIESKHKRLIGWDEILEGGLPPNAAVMCWHGTAMGIEAVKAGHDVVMSPSSNLYLDHSQTQRRGEPPTIGGYLPLENVYSYDPFPGELTADLDRHVLGAQGNLWTEYMPNLKQVEHMAFPRACALAELTWTGTDRKDFRDFLLRLEVLKRRLDVLGVNYFRDTGAATSTAPSAP